MNETFEQMALRVAKEVRGQQGDLNIQCVELAAMTQERDKWMEDSLRQTKTIQRLADAAEDRNNVDVSREAFHAEQLAASQAREQQLREALNELTTGKFPKEGDEYADDSMRLFARNALDIPQDTAALKQYGAKLLRNFKDNVRGIMRDNTDPTGLSYMGCSQVQEELDRVAGQRT